MGLISFRLTCLGGFSRPPSSEVRVRTTVERETCSKWAQENSVCRVESPRPTNRLRTRTPLGPAAVARGLLSECLKEACTVWSGPVADGPTLDAWFSRHCCTAARVNSLSGCWYDLLLERVPLREICGKESKLRLQLGRSYVPGNTAESIRDTSFCKMPLVHTLLMR